MSEARRCTRCGGPLPQNGELGGRCPRCMFERGFESSFGEAQSAKPGTARERPSIIGRYRILGLIGEGGMGTVYEAEQEHPRRTVALKIIKLGMASPSLLRRFEQESQALGRLQHPGIAQIFEAGTVDTGFGPQPYFAMEFIRGRSLQDYCESNHLNIKQRLEIIVKICDAVQHAHQRGLIHRDLKPGNILVDDAGQPKVLDFGVARVTDSDARATQRTDLGQLVGTLAYMSPEQALADPLDIDTRSDVYSVGVILYELLAGRLPYTLGKNLHDAIQVIREQEPTPLSAANRAFRGDIETIVAKALEKDRTRRYASAAELAADIQRYLNNEPIVARRPSATYQLLKFARRHRALVAGTAAVFLVLVSGIITSTWLLARATKDRDRALRAEGLANEKEREAAQARVDEREQRNIAEAARVQAEAQTVLTQQALSEAQVNLYHSQIESADREGMASNVHNADRLLEEAPVTLRNWEWHYLARRNHMEEGVIAGHQDAILAMALGPDGKQLRTVSADNTVKLWDLETRKEISTATLGDEASAVVLGNGGRILYALVTKLTSPSSYSIRQQLLDLSTGSTAQVPALAYWGSSVALSPNGKRAAAVVVRDPPASTLLHCWNIETGIELFAPVELTGRITSLVFSPDESMLAVMQNGSILLLNATNGHELVRFGNPQDTFMTGAFNREGTTFVAGSDYGLRAWRTLDGREQWSIQGESVNHIAWSPDSRHIATAGDDQTIRLFDSMRAREIARLVGHTGTIHALTFTQNGARLLSAGDDRLVHIWAWQEESPPLIFDVGGPARRLVVSRDGKTLLSGTKTSLTSWNTTNGLVDFELQVSATYWKMVFSGDSAPFVFRSRVVAGQRGLARANEVVALDVRSRREIAVFDWPGGIQNWDDSEFWVSPDGNRAAMVSLNRPRQDPGQELTHWQTEVQIGETSAGNGNIHFRVDNAVIGLSRFSPDGKFAAFGISLDNGSKTERKVEIYNTTTRRRLHRLETTVNGLWFSPIGNQLAVVEPGRTISIWDALTGTKLASTREVGKSGTTIVRVAFSPDATRLASVSSDGEVWLWDTKTGKKVILLRHSSGPYEVSEVTAISKTDPREIPWAPNGKDRTLSFSQDGGKITLSSVSRSTEGLTIRIETWDGRPR